jgi:hypothetical protein
MMDFIHCQDRLVCLVVSIWILVISLISRLFLENVTATKQELLNMSGLNLNNATIKIQNPLLYQRIRQVLVEDATKDSIMTRQLKSVLIVQMVSSKVQTFISSNQVLYQTHVKLVVRVQLL